MEPDETTRRRYLMAAGTTATAMLAGCQGSNPEDTTTTTATTTAKSEETTTESEDYPEDTNPDDGYPPEFDDQPSAMDFDADSFPTVREQAESGSTVEVPLVPLDVAHNLYARRKARMMDARAELGYRVSHVLGAVRSPAPTGSSDGPTNDWPKSDRVVVYCHCPIHLAVQRAANLIDSGFEAVYALAGGYQAWQVADYPTAGKGVPATAKTWTIDGETANSDADGVAYVYHSATDQVSSAKIASDGSYSIEFAFESVSGSDTVTVGTPSYEVEGTLRSFAGATVTADDATGTTTTGSNETATTTDGTTNSTTAMNGTTTTNSTTTNDTAMPGSDGTSTDSNSSDTDDIFGRLVGGRFW
ncbi:rhodanese-like domain-containing protein [Halorussus salinisoli]|uniref:rhodanese-like domain-containing protein n=1 Tax=Halorussus salinisoli TaxID=2558242 RepID=UPI0010C20214|nr:rhodanese-like domain-containing protein [Halorussus salinisoli]